MAAGTVLSSPPRIAGRPAAGSCVSTWERCAGYCVSPGGMASGTASPYSLGTAGRSAAVSCGSPWDRCAGYCVSPRGRPSATVPRGQECPVAPERYLAGRPRTDAQNIAHRLVADRPVTAPPSSLGMAGHPEVGSRGSSADRRAEDCRSLGDKPAPTMPPCSLGIPGGTGCMSCVFSPDRCAIDCALPPFAKWALSVPASCGSSTSRKCCQRRL